MRYKVLTCISFISFCTITCDGVGTVGISSKLDFGDSRSSPQIVGTATQYRSASIPYKHTRRQEIKTEGDFGGIGVVCVSGGCNKTKSENESKDSIQTDVVVHVKTSVNLNKTNKTNFIDDTPDVPIIVGTAGTDSRTYHQGPSSVSGFNKFSSPDSSFSASIVPSVPTISSSGTPSVVPSYSTVYSSPGLSSDNVYLHSPSLPSEPRVDINIKTLPSVSLTMSNDGGVQDVRYKTNGVELRYPYFEPSFQNHYFGESPPPQLVWYPKRTGVSNTVDYKPKSHWKPSLWSSGTSGGTPHRHSVGSETCTCKNQPATGLQWHPTRRVYQDPGRHIDDKLAELS